MARECAQYDLLFFNLLRVSLQYGIWPIFINGSNKFVRSTYYLIGSIINTLYMLTQIFTIIASQTKKMKHKPFPQVICPKLHSKDSADLTSEPSESGCKSMIFYDRMCSRKIHTKKDTIFSLPILFSYFEEILNTLDVRSSKPLCCGQVCLWRHPRTWTGRLNISHCY